ncbi:MAG: LysM peptidoglycan-binding domain-containing protein, partial [Gemmatimonadetes bacterium]|nr:LysM peptidoglycan-binding domain-containing protein [Gemmatimonadota bacterium]
VAEPAPAPPAQPSPAPETATPTQTHRIQSGETLSHLARRYGITVGDIERANPGLNARRIQVGQVVRIPTAGGTSAATPATPQAAPAQDPPAATPAARSHTIRSGDTLDGISKQYGTTVSALQQANPGLNARRLIPGNTIRIP